MTRKLIHFFNRLSQKVALKVIKMSDPIKYQPNTRSEYENECVGICRKLIPKEDTTLLMSPISGKRYIKCDEMQIFIIIQNTKMTLVNHHYSYTINIEGRAYERISKMFDDEIERRREIMEAEIRSNVKHSLNTIYKNLIHEQV